ncbi:group II intron reverse transcriptase/maturase [Streptomyces sp. NPDC055722]
MGLFVPNAVIRERCARYMSHGIPAPRCPLFHDDDFTIIAKYGTEYRGFVQYYLLAQDVFRLDTLYWVMETSMLKTWPPSNIYGHGDGARPQGDHRYSARTPDLLRSRSAAR